MLESYASARLRRVVLTLLSVGVSSFQLEDQFSQALHHGSGTKMSGSTTTGLAVLMPESMDDNPFLRPPLNAFMEKFNIPKVHGSGIYVDLGTDKTVNGKSYREAAGKCPVFGKNIITYQPLGNPLYKNDFLTDIPTQGESAAAGHPLPGGFNSNFKLQDGSRYSPMSVSRLNSIPELKAKTSLGKCAELSFNSNVQNYRYPFVFDEKNGLCYFLYITMQRLMGERYCSNHDKPKGLTWYCFEPMKAQDVRPHLVYGSSYVGENPDSWETNCPNKGVSGAVFGEWKNGKCVEHRHDSRSEIVRVVSKDDCWARAFTNAGVASDHPVTDAENIGTFGYYFPLSGSNQPKSKGEGVNYASFYGGGIMECVLSKVIPTCFVPIHTGVAYTALGGMEEEPLPFCTDQFPKSNGSCDPKTCKGTVTTCIDGQLVVNEEDCEPEDGSKCESNLSLIIGLSVAGGLLLLSLLAASLFFYRRRKPKQLPPREVSRREYMQEEAVTQRQKARASDLVQQAEPSFWEEIDAEAEGGDTQVIIDQDY